MKATTAALARRAREMGAARMQLPAMEEKSVLPGLLDLFDPPVDEEEEEDDPFGDGSPAAARTSRSASA